ncbi:MAG: hypothetical protein DRI86_14920 [Bacteroidetes bacterium]|nr:MAG: hypothetical protein DRI86_14920 [Bacteroidota bacterium]
MKKVIITLMLGITISLGSIAQDNKHNIGAYMGGGLSSTYSFFSNSIGYDFGLSYTYKLNKTFAIITGLDYDIRSSYIVSDIKNTAGDIVDYEFKHSFGFLNVPLMLNTSFGNKVKYFVNTGVSLGYLVRFKQTVDIGGEIFVDRDKEFWNRFGIDLNIGIGVQFPLSDKVDLSVEARYKQGLNELRRQPAFENEKQTSFNALLLIGLNYKL